MGDGDKRSRRRSAGAGRSRNAKQPAIPPMEARFRAVFENSRDAIGVSKAGIHVFVNPAYLDLFGFPRGSDLEGKPVLDLIAPGSRDQIQVHILRRLLGQPVPSAYETRGLRVDGSEFDMEVSVSSYREHGEDHTLVILRDISRQRRAEEEIAERGAMLRQIMDTASVGIGLVDMTGRISHANRRMAEMFGRTLEELVGCEYVELVHPSERETGRRNMLALLASEIPAVDLERRYRRKDGTEFWGHLACRRLHDVHGKELGLIGVITDVSVRRQAEEALHDSEGRLNTILDHVGAAIFIKDAQYRYSYVNRRVCEIFGRSPEQIIGRRDDEFLPAESVEEITRSDRPVIERGATVTREETEPRSTDEVPRTYWTVKLPLRDGSGTVTGLCGISTDVTMLKQSEAKYRRLYNETPVMLQSIDRGGIVLDVNEYWLKTMGYERDEVIGRKATEFYAPASRTYAEEIVQPAFFREGSAKDIQYQFVRKSGDLVDVLLSATAERDANGAVVRSLAVAVDVTERRRMEEELRLSEARYRAITMTASDAILLMDDAGRIVYWNPAAERIFGYRADEAVGRQLHGLLAPERMHDTYRGGFAQFVATGQGPVVNRTVEMAAVKKDGTEFPIEISTSAMNVGGHWHALGIVRDITDRKRLEQELFKAEKLTSIGTLAGGIAHDFNNLLQGVFGFIAMAKLTIDQRDKSLAMLAQAEKALHQSVNLTSQLLTFSKGGKPAKEVVDVRPVIEDSVAFALSGSRVTYEIVADANLHAVEADTGQIGQVIQNIVLNADQAMPLGGTIRVSVRNVAARQLVPPAALPDDLVEIAIRDEGTGIPADHLTRIFDPYFTTKEKGSGLGLATSYSIVKNHGGLLRAQSEVGRGTTFFVYLPATAARRPKAEHAGSPAARRTARILVMDDEEMIRTVAKELLTALGHESALAETGETALAAWRAARDAGRPFDAVILDLTIRGGMGGVETLRKLLAIDPGVKAIVSSGYSDDAALANYRDQGFRNFLKKPYDLSQLQGILNDLLG